MRERHTNGKKNTFKQGLRNQGNPYPYLRKNASYARAMRASDRKTVILRMKSEIAETVRRRTEHDR